MDVKAMTEHIPSRAEIMGDLEVCALEIADAIDRVQAHMESYGSDNELALCETRLREAGVWMLAAQATCAGNNIQDSLRGI
jgi:predicted amidohydrolase